MNWIAFADQSPPVGEDLLCWKAGRGYEMMYLRADGRLVDDEDGGWYTDKENEPTHWCILDAPK